MAHFVCLIAKPDIKSFILKFSEYHILKEISTYAFLETFLREAILVQTRGGSDKDYQKPGKLKGFLIRAWANTKQL